MECRGLSLFAERQSSTRTEFDYKLRWFRRLTDYAAELHALEVPIILAGDYNVMPIELDVYKPERWVDDALFGLRYERPFEPWSLKAGRMRCGRFIRASASICFGNYFRNAWGRNAGLRLDHLLLNSLAAKRLVAAEVDREIRGSLVTTLSSLGPA